MTDGRRLTTLTVTQKAVSQFLASRASVTPRRTLSRHTPAIWETLRHTSGPAGGTQLTTSPFAAFSPTSTKKAWARLLLRARWRPCARSIAGWRRKA